MMNYSVGTTPVFDYLLQQKLQQQGGPTEGNVVGGNSGSSTLGNIAKPVVSAGIKKGISTALGGGAAQAGGSFAGSGAITTGAQAIPGATGAASGAGGAGLSGALGTAGTVGAVAAGAILAGRGIKETGDALFDGDVTKDDALRGFGVALSGGLAHGLNDVLGSPVHQNDLNNAMLLGSGIGAPLALLNMAGVLDGFGHSEDYYEKKARNAQRQNLQDTTNLLDDDYNFTLANGEKYSSEGEKFEDGSFKFNLFDEETGEAKTGFDDRLDDTIGSLDALNAVLTGGDEKLTSDYTGYMAQAAYSGGNLEDNIAKFYSDAGLDRESAMERIRELADKDKTDNPISEELRDVYLASIDRTFS